MTSSGKLRSPGVRGDKLRSPPTEKVHSPPRSAIILPPIVSDIRMEVRLQFQYGGWGTLKKSTPSLKKPKQTQTFLDIFRLFRNISKCQSKSSLKLSKYCYKQFYMVNNIIEHDKRVIDKFWTSKFRFSKNCSNRLQMDLGT